MGVEKCDTLTVFIYIYIYIYIKSFYFVVKDMHCYRHWNQGMMM